MTTEGKPAKPVRDCTACGRPLTLAEIIYSSDYPEQVLTSKGTVRAGTLKDAPRVWCGADCAKASYERR